MLRKTPLPVSSFQGFGHVAVLFSTKKEVYVNRLNLCVLFLFDTSKGTTAHFQLFTASSWSLVAWGREQVWKLDVPSHRWVLFLPHPSSGSSRDGPIRNFPKDFVTLPFPFPRPHRNSA